MKTKILFLLLALYSLNSFALIIEEDHGQDGNGSDYKITIEEKRLCKYVLNEMKDSENYTVYTSWKGQQVELSKVEIETKCCEINPAKCDKPGPELASDRSDKSDKSDQ